MQGLPVEINGYLGDALLGLQWNDTLSKLESLYASNHLGDVMIPTKKIMTKEQQEILSRNYKNVWIFFAITGLDELGLGSLAPYEEAYLSLCEKFANVVCAFRPIMPNQNDKREVVTPIIEMVSRGNKLLTYTGYKDIYDASTPQYRNEEFYTYIREYCAAKGVTVREKCIEIRAASKGTNGFDKLYDDCGLEMARQLGYSVEVVEGKIILSSRHNLISKGDLNFVKLLAKSSSVSSSNFVNSQILSLKLLNGLKLVCTSSWFQWARQVPCAVGCSYCFADYRSVIRTQPSRFGCNPIEILKLIQTGDLS